MAYGTADGGSFGLTSPIEHAPLRVSGSAPVELEQATEALIADDLAIRSSSGLDQFVIEALVIVLGMIVRTPL